MGLDLKEILNLKFETGDLMWVWFRFSILNNSFEKRNSKKSFIVLKIFNIIKSFKYIFFKRKKIIFITSTDFNFKSENGKRFINIQDKPYFDVFPNDTQIYEYPDNNINYKVPNVQKFSSFLFLIEVFCLSLAKLTPLRIRNEQKKFVTLLNNKIDIKEVQKVENNIRYLKKGYEIFFKLTRPKIVFINCSFYGNKQGLLTKIAKDLGIKVVETQHGIVKGNFAYNYTNYELENLNLRKYFPDYFLVYGTEWMKETNVPANIVVVGNHNLNEYSKKEKKNDINSYLIISRYDVTNIMIKLTENLYQKNKNAIITFRLHPNEVLNKTQVEKLRKLNVKFSDKKENLYDEILRNYNIVGLNSNCLNEAIAFERKIYILDSIESRRSISTQVGNWIDNDFNIKIKNINNKNDYWEENFTINYKNFIEQIFNELDKKGK